MLYVRFLSLFISLSLFIAPLPLSAVAKAMADRSAIAEEMMSPIAQFEADIIEKNSDASYIELGKERSNIAEIVAILSYWDERDDSLLQALNKHIQNGFSVAEYDAVLEALEYAASVLQKNYAQLDSAYAEKIATNLNEIIFSITNGSLTRRSTLVFFDIID